MDSFKFSAVRVVLLPAADSTRWMVRGIDACNATVQEEVKREWSG